MRVLLVHNFYTQRGGEDESFEAEASMLKSFGHEVQQYTRHNNDVKKLSRLRVAIDTLWNQRSRTELVGLIEEFKPDVIHCTNLFPLISPSAYAAANDCGVPVVQSLRNYRPMCSNAIFFRDGEVCEKCIGTKLGMPGVVHGCYRNSRIASGVVAAHNSYHSAFGTWRTRVQRFFTPTEFARSKYIEAGFPGDKIAVKPNFLASDPGRSNEPRKFGLFVGRLAPEKGLQTLVDAWIRSKVDFPLRIVGRGFQERYIARMADQHPNIYYEGQLPLSDVEKLLGSARFLVMPSEWYETFGRTIMEAFSRGTPVIVSRMGAMAELVCDGVAGLTYTPKSVDELVTAIRTMIEDDSLHARLSNEARKIFERRYTAKANHEVLLSIYRDAIAEWAVQNSPALANGKA